MTHPLPPTRRDRTVLIVAATVIILCGMTLYGIMLTRTEERDNARNNEAEAVQRAETAEQYVARIDADCKGASGERLARELQAMNHCGVAERIVKEANANPLPGRDGRDGANGRDGADGRDGKDGRDGADGQDGGAGSDGRGIASSVVNEDGDLILTYSDGTVFNAGRVRGTRGADGKDGTDGRDGTTPDLTGYATEDWVLTLIRALGCETTLTGNGPPLVLSCTVTGKP